MTPQIEQHLMANGNLSLKRVVLNNLFGGIAWGIGTVIGASLVLSLLIGFFRTFNFIPYSDQVVKTIESNPASDKNK